ncbi:MAG: fatty acid desaturase [Deltaproteobacteria bacterium]|jgi:beta-carotene hydroxylase
MVDADFGAHRTGWPAVTMSVAAHLLTATIWWAVLGGHLPTPAGTIAMMVPGYIAFTPLHEACHGNIGGSRERAWMDVAFGWSSAAILLAPLALFRAAHLRHHGNVNHDRRDPDHWVARFRGVWTPVGCLTFLPRYYWNFFVGAVPGAHQSAERRKSWAGVAAFVTFSAVMTWLGLGWAVLTLWVLPAILTGGVLAFLFAWLPHHPFGDRRRWTNAWLYDVAGLGVPMMGHNLHLIHHLWPRIPFHRYGDVFRERRAELDEHGARVWSRR